MPNTTDTAGDDTTRRTVAPTAHEQFLASLSADRAEAALRYDRLHKRLAGFFRFKGVSDPEGAVAITFDRAAVKIAGGATVPDVERYCFGIARFVAMERLRDERREHSALAQYAERLQAAPAEQEEQERIYETMKTCFDQLADKDQRLLTDYCKVLRGRARAEYRRELAERMGTTVVALRMRVTRLRGVLSDCVKNLAGDGFVRS